MERLNIEAMEQVQGGLLAGFLVGLGVLLLMDDDFRQGLADGWVGAPRN